MADTAAFFAKKKKAGTKKKFKAFNANKIDVSTVTSTTHVDAPEISNNSGVGDITSSLGGLSSLGGATGVGSLGDDGIKVAGEWADDDATSNTPGAGGGWGANSGTGNAAPGESKVAELLDMKALQAKRNEQDDVRERMRIEETKAQLARAKEGMAKEAERLAAEKAEKEKKESARMAGSAMGAGDSGGKWVPSHMRGGGSSMGGSRFGAAAASTGVRNVDVASEELFPDLAAADKILAEKEQQEKNQKKPVTAPAGWMGVGGAGTAKPAQRQPLNLAPRSASGEEAPSQRKPLNLAPPSSKKSEEASTDAAPTGDDKKESKPIESSPEPSSTEAPAVAKPEASAPAPAAEAAPAAKAAPEKEKKVLKKKKKKDLSTFKPGSS